MRGRDRQVIRGLSFRIGRGETFGLVGKSGCGKSTVALAVTRYLPANGRVRAGGIRIAGEDALAMDATALRRLRTRSMSDGLSGPRPRAEPLHPLGQQVAEVFEIAGVPASERMDRAEAMLQRRAHRRCRPRHEPLPAPALGRHAAARGHRDGARRGPDAAHPR